MRAQQQDPSRSLPVTFTQPQARSAAENAPPQPADGVGQVCRVDSLDIGELLTSWEFEPGRLNVRKIQGDDGRPKLQIRLDLGLLQMELSGRPDGRRPHDFPSVFDYHVERLNEHRTRLGTELGFVLSPNDCRELRDEASMYYHRYLGLFVLGDYAGTMRDARRNLQVIDFCRRHAAEEADQVAMQVYRPYLLMMTARARAGLCVQKDDARGALRAIRVALREIRRHYRRFGKQRAWEGSVEVRVLRKLARHLERSVPQSPVRRLKRALERAIRSEQYERAAEIRDKLARLES